MPTTTPDTGRTAVLTLESLARRLDELAERAFDLEDRYSEETDRDVAVQISTFQNLADSCVWSCHTDFDDEKGLERLRFAYEKASKAWSFLRSECPAVQRSLKEPSAEDAEFIRERNATRIRSNSPYCTIHPRASGDGYDALRQVQLPREWRVGFTLDSILHRCINLAQARRMLRAFGLPADYAEDNGERVLLSHGHFISCRK